MRTPLPRACGTPLARLSTYDAYLPPPPHVEQTGDIPLRARRAPAPGIRQARSVRTMVCCGVQARGQTPCCRFGLTRQIAGQTVGTDGTPLLRARAIIPKGAADSPRCGAYSLRLAFPSRFLNMRRHRRAHILILLSNTTRALLSPPSPSVGEEPVVRLS